MTNVELEIRLDGLRKEIDKAKAEITHIKSMLTEPRIRRARVKSKSTKQFDKYLLK